MDYFHSRDFTCCFTGYRPEKLPWGIREDDPRCRELKYRLGCKVRDLFEEGIARFICGMARGSDTYFAEIVLGMRKKEKGVILEAAIPCETQADRWSAEERERYNYILRQCDNVNYISRAYTRSCMAQRNRYMVDNSCVIIAVYDGKPGGTAQTISYAARNGLQIIQLKP